MYRELVSCADFKAILTPFSEVIWSRYSFFYGKADHSINRWPDVTPQIAFSSKGKVPNRNKNNSSIKANKFHSKYVCFGGRKTREERKLCLKIRLFGFPETLVMRHATTQRGFILNSDWSIWIWARARAAVEFECALKFKWTSRSWEWNHVASGRCRRVTRKHWPPVHGPPLRTGSVDYLRTGPRTTPTDPSKDHPPK